jgi:hypothetical protein
MALVHKWLKGREEFLALRNTPASEHHHRKVLPSISEFAQHPQATIVAKCCVGF